MEVPDPQFWLEVLDIVSPEEMVDAKSLGVESKVIPFAESIEDLIPAICALFWEPDIVLEDPTDSVVTKAYKEGG